MRELLAASRAIDAVTTAIGRSVAWLIVLAATISAGNAVVRKALDTSSNAWLEMQWWLFGAVFLLAAPWTLSSNEHIRIDIVNSRLSRRSRNVIELAGLAFFLLPLCAVMVATSWPFFLRSAPSAAEFAAWAANFDVTAPLSGIAALGRLGEQSSNAGGLPQWPVKALIPAAFALLFVQGISELIKRAAVIKGDLDEPAPGSGGHLTGVIPGRGEDA